MGIILHYTYNKISAMNILIFYMFSAVKSMCIFRKFVISFEKNKFDFELAIEIWPR